MYDLIIIGAGPAGLTAGLYAGRFKLKAMILEKISIGGQIISSPWIDNYPGFPGGLSTQDLIERLKQQVDSVGVVIEIEEVFEITGITESKIPLYYKVKAGDKSYETKTIIIASGAQPKRLGVEGENKLIGRGVSYCGTCDAPLFKNKEVVVIGGGDRAVEEAIFLTSYASRVTVIHRRQEFRASKILEEKVKANPKIHYVLDSVVEKINGEIIVDSVKIRNVKTNVYTQLSCHGVFIFVGIKPNTEFLKNLLNINNQGFIITGQTLKTSREGIYACGDCLEKNLYQVVNACSDGAVAVDSAHKYLLLLKG